MGSTYTLDQAQKDIANLRGTLAHMLAFTEFLQVQIDGILTLAGQATPAVGAAGTAEVYSNNARGQGHLKYVSDDGVDYATGRVTSYGPPNQGISSTSFVSLTNMAVSLGVGTYKFGVLVALKANANAGQWAVEINFSGTASTSYEFRFTSAAGVQGLNANVTAFSTTLAGPATSVLGFYWAEIYGKITVSAAGSLSVLGKTTVAADTWNAFDGSWIEAYPVV